jgi:hypothetical protein
MSGIHARLLFALVVGVLVAFATPAHAQTFDPFAYAPQIVAAVQAHHWLVVLGLALATIVAAAAAHRAGVAKLVPWFATDAGATVLTFLLAAAGSLATTFAAGQTPSRATASAAFGVGVVAIGGYTGARKLLGPSGLGRWFPIGARIADALGPVNPAPATTKEGSAS